MGLFKATWLIACAGIFRNNQGASKGCFAAIIGIANSLHVELMGIILAVEIAFDKTWHHLWI